MSTISLSRLLRPLQWLLWLALLAVVLPLIMIITTPILLLVWSIGLVMAIASRTMREQMGATPLGVALLLPLWAVLLVSTSVPTLALVLAGALHSDWQVAHALPQYLKALDLQRHEIALVCVAAGIVGVSANCVYAFIDIPWRLKQIRQVRALPRSKARSAAIGLAEFEGTVRAAGTDGAVSKPGSEKSQPFYLEDETGRIRVDPQGATVRPRSTSGVSLQLNEVEAGIRDGDRVYVIGNVQVRETQAPDAQDSSRLVVRPLRQQLVSSPVGRLLFSKGNVVADRDAPNIFIVDKGREHDVALRLRMALWDFCAITGIYLAISLWLVQAAWPWLA